MQNAGFLHSRHEKEKKRFGVLSSYFSHMRVKQNRLGDSLRTVSLIIKQKGYIIKNIMNCMKKKKQMFLFFSFVTSMYRYRRLYLIF